MVTTLISKKGFLAIRQPQFKKIESTMKGGLAVAAQRTEMISVPLVMDYILDGERLFASSHEVILRGDSGLQAWAKQIFEIDGVEFVLCPETAVIGIKHVFGNTITTGTPAQAGGTGGGIRG